MKITIPGKPRELVGPNTRITIRNLHYDISEEDLEDLLSMVGDVVEVVVEYDHTGRSTGVAHITFTKPEDARIAIQRLDQETLDGQVMHISMYNTVAPLGKDKGRKDDTAKILSRLGDRSKRIQQEKEAKTKGKGQTLDYDDTTTGRVGERKHAVEPATMDISDTMAEYERKKGMQKQRENVWVFGRGRGSRTNHHEQKSQVTEDDLDKDITTYMG